ncbi:helix-turn-helix domain-containing protein [Euzebya sp.]|uniref:helix-turn-helix domain-containing protein n=1 Tax=Euzebya sp. TaxID=1971409 RepID=UPI003511A23C
MTPPDTASPDRLMTIAQVADRLGVEVRHMRRLVHERRIPYIKWGHLLRFDPDDIETWIDANRHHAVARRGR